MTKTDTTSPKGDRTSNDSKATAEKKAGPHLIVHAQYIKDFSFENPNSPTVLIENHGQPDVEINVSVGAKLISDNQYEVLEGLVAGEEVVTNGTFTLDAEAQLQGKISMMSFNGKSVNNLKAKITFEEISFSDPKDYLIVTSCQIWSISICLPY